MTLYKLKLFRAVLKIWGNIVGAEENVYLLFYRFWRYVSSVWIRRPSPRRPWPQVRWGVWRAQRGSSPLPLYSGSQRLTAVGTLPRLPAKHPSVSAGTIRAQVKRSSSDARLPHAPARKQSHPPRDRCVPSPLRPVTKKDRKWFLPTGMIRPTQQKTLMGSFA